LHVGHGGILSGLLSGAGVGNDLCRIEQELAATDTGAEGVEVATGYQVAHGAVGHTEHAGGISGSHEERARWRLRRGHRGGKIGGGGRHKKNGGNGRIITCDPGRVTPWERGMTQSELRSTNYEVRSRARLRVCACYAEANLPRDAANSEKAER